MDKIERKKIVVNGEETNYSITTEGKIYNDKTGRELKGTYSTNEYHSVQLMINGKPKTFLFHRLLAEAFIPNPNNLPVVDHIDRNKHNDNLDNLRWSTLSDNALNSNQTNPTKGRKLEGEIDWTVWKKIKGCEGYAANKNGEIVNLISRRYLVFSDRNGYKRINLNKKAKSVHRVIWETFNEQEIPEGYQIDHINGNKSDNRLENLRLVSSSENMKNAYNNGHKGAVKVYQYSLKGEFIKEYPSYEAAAQEMNVTNAAIRGASDRQGTCQNYYWLKENQNINDIFYSWVPKGFKILPNFPTYCINSDGKVYNKRNKSFCNYHYRSNGEPYIYIGKSRIDVITLLNSVTF